MKGEATITEKGQVIIPKAIRDKSGLKKGRKVYFELRGEEAAILPEVKGPGGAQAVEERNTGSGRGNPISN
ncbi:MAG: AbrB/MazE/SpoVT family DNA-binding domain-containing protein [Theionarchaea archaeon]|nr:AbrB/MazE/SpoVT family DNA-binding domain-containing protein [Theionarchaea archaeon]